MLIKYMNHPEFLKEWPKRLGPPESIELVRAQWDFTHAHTSIGFFDPEDDDYGDGPEIVLTWKDGNTLTLTEIDPTDCNPEEEVWTGDWLGCSTHEKYAAYDALMALFDILAPHRILASVEDLG